LEGEKQKILVGQKIQTAIKSLPSWVLSMKATDFVDQCSEPAFEQNYNVRLSDVEQLKPLSNDMAV
jgi:hypothetical protein